MYYICNIVSCNTIKMVNYKHTAIFKKSKGFIPSDVLKGPFLAGAACCTYLCFGLPLKYYRYFIVQVLVFSIRGFWFKAFLT